MIRMINKPIEDKIHIDDLRSLEMVSIDRLVHTGSGRIEDRERKNTTVFETVQLPND